jgi:hypothetical protein
MLAMSFVFGLMDEEAVWDNRELSDLTHPPPMFRFNAARLDPK